MKAVLKMEGLCCASCATRIEEKVRTIPGVDDANLSFMTQKLTIEGDEARMDQILSEASRIAKRIEGDVRIERLK